MPKPIPRFTRVCSACFREHETHKAKAKRCQECINEGRRGKRRVCLGCSKAFAPTDQDQINCQPCADAFDIHITEMTPAQLEALEAERRRERFVNRRDHQLAWLDKRSRSLPKGYKRMTKATAETALGELWLNICATDGAASASVVRTLGTDIGPEDRLTLLISYYSLRVKDYHPDALARLCPKAILKGDAKINAVLNNQTINLDKVALGLDRFKEYRT